MGTETNIPTNRKKKKQKIRGTVVAVYANVMA